MLINWWKNICSKKITQRLSLSSKEQISSANGIRPRKMRAPRTKEIIRLLESSISNLNHYSTRVYVYYFPVSSPRVTNTKVTSYSVHKPVLIDFNTSSLEMVARWGHDLTMLLPATCPLVLWVQTHFRNCRGSSYERVSSLFVFSTI